MSTKKSTLKKHYALLQTAQNALYEAFNEIDDPMYREDLQIAHQHVWHTRVNLRIHLKGPNEQDRIDTKKKRL
jgi:hypothetical protein